MRLHDWYGFGPDAGAPKSVQRSGLGQMRASAFELQPSRVELTIVGVVDTPEATHIRYRVL